jgi:hypothetical protein
VWPVGCIFSFIQLSGSKVALLESLSTPPCGVTCLMNEALFAVFVCHMSPVDFMQDVFSVFEFSTEWFSVYPNITLKFHIITIFKTFFV